MTDSSQKTDILLRVKNLRTHFPTAKGLVKAVDGVSFSLRQGEILGLVGESGAGKSVLGFSIMGLIEAPGKIVDGEIILGGRDLCKMPAGQLREVRGQQVSMIFQDPLTCLDPVFSIGFQMSETLNSHRKMDSRIGRARAVDLLNQVSIASPAERLRDYPHQFSGGMRQRVGIAMGISGEPQLIIADEPTTALDVTIQAQIMTLLHRLVRQKGASMILITHDIALVAQICDTIGVMYAGHLVEMGPKTQVINRPLHPYTRGLILSIPGTQEAKGKLYQIPGMMPDLSCLPHGCPFGPRCDSAGARCAEIPEMKEREPGHSAACHQWQGEANG